MAKYRLQRLFSEKNTKSKNNQQKNSSRTNKNSQKGKSSSNYKFTEKDIQNAREVGQKSGYAAAKDELKGRIDSLEKSLDSYKRYQRNPLSGKSIAESIKKTWNSGTKGKAKVLAVPTTLAAVGTLAGLSLKKNDPNVEYNRDYKY